MPKRNIFILDEKSSPWVEFLREFFEDTPDSQPQFIDDALRAVTFLQKTSPDITFINSKLLTLPLTQKLKVMRQTRPSCRLFQIAAASPVEGLHFDESFDEIQPLVPFQKQLVQYLALPDKIRVLVVDDEQEIHDLVHDYLENRTLPSFEIHDVDNGKRGLEAIEKIQPDVIVLDVKMPVMDGRETYREIKARGIKIPVIIFFDAISGDEMVQIRKFGRPAVVEKAGRAAAMPEMISLIKKMAYFG